MSIGIAQLSFTLAPLRKVKSIDSTYMYAPRENVNRYPGDACRGSLERIDHSVGPLGDQVRKGREIGRWTSSAKASKRRYWWISNTAKDLGAIAIFFFYLTNVGIWDTPTLKRYYCRCSGTASLEIFKIKKKILQSFAELRFALFYVVLQYLKYCCNVMQ